MRYALLITFAVTFYLYAVIPEAQAESYDLTFLWFSKGLSKIIDKGCEQARNKKHCVQVASFIGWNESTAGKNAYHFNIWGMHGGESKSEQEAFDKWFSIYNRWWYKTHGVGDFYSPTPKPPRTHYCMSEHESDGRYLNFCPQGFRNATHYLSLFNSKYERPTERVWELWKTFATESKIGTGSSLRSDIPLSPVHVPVKGWQAGWYHKHPKKPHHWVETEQSGDKDAPNKKRSDWGSNRPKLQDNHSGDKHDGSVTDWSYNPNFDWKHIIY